MSLIKQSGGLNTIKRMNTREIAKAYSAGRPLVMLTAYSHWMARMIDQHVDMILVGDSLGNVVLGYDTTLPVEMEDMIHHGAAVVRAVSHAMVIMDMPFLSYQCSVEEAVRNAGILMKKTGAGAVKLEGASWLPAVSLIVEAGIPVMGHIGLTPQSVHAIGGFRKQGKKRSDAERICKEARALEEAGCFAIVLECVPDDLAARITGSLSIPTIGIGAGPNCSGQVLVTHDMLGLLPETPNFVRQYDDLSGRITDAVSRYSEEVRSRKFP